MIRVLAARRIAVTPTLKLWGVDVPPDWTKAQREGVVERGIAEVRLLRAVGVVLIFGTDVGYMDDPDPRDLASLGAPGPR
jgi:imidazolonepropionase-like amidohydrolase